MTSVIIPNAITHVEYYAFAGIPNIQSITIGANVSLENTAFLMDDEYYLGPSKFVLAYDGIGELAGTYTYNGTAWTRN